MYWFDSTAIINEINEINIMIIFCWLVSGHIVSTLTPHSSFFCMESITFPQSFGCGWAGSLTSTGADLQLPAVSSDSLTSPEPPPAPQANRCVWPAGSDCTDRKASKRGGRYSIKSVQTVFTLYFYSDDSTSFTQDILPFFSVRNCLFAPEKEPTRKLRAGVTLGHSEADWKIS